MGKRTIFATLALLALALPAALFYRQPRQAPCPNCNVLLVSIDALRSDRLGVYGNARPASPQIDLFAKDSVLFENAIAQGPSTAVSHAAMLTSLPPAMHGAFITRMSSISPAVPTLAELLKARGFKTASFNGGGQVGKEFGFARGFDLYASFSGSDYTAEFFEDRVKEFIEWHGKNSAAPFFVFLHSYEAHTPFAPRAEHSRIFNPNYTGNLPHKLAWGTFEKINTKALPFGQADRDFVIGQYDAEVRSVDTAFGDLLAYLKRQRLYDNTLIIFTSDHGEELGEHGKWGLHSHTLYDELLKVPLIIKFPDSARSGASIKPQVAAGLDLVPTIFETLGIDPLAHFEGRPLQSIMRGESSSAYVISQRDSRHKRIPTAVRSAKWKLIKDRLFDLVSDPGERIDNAADNQQVLNEMKPLMERYSAAIPPEAAATSADEQALEQLKTLGYLK